MKNLIKINQLSKKEIFEILKLTEKIEKNPKKYLDKLKGKSLATMFFQQSTRTRISSSLAIQKLGGNVVDLYETKYEVGMTQAESFEDTIKVVGGYVDAICLRHQDENAPFIAEKNTSAKIINCGNGKDEHPTQTLIDMYSIWKKFRTLDKLSISIVGDLKNSRSAHSLLTGLSNFNNNEINLISPKRLRMPKKYIECIKNKQTLIETSEFEIKNEDVVYMAGLPGEECDEPERKKYQLTLEKAKKLKKRSIIMNPLPKIDEIAKDVDTLPNAAYFEQSKNGLYVRMATLINLLKN